MKLKMNILVLVFFIMPLFSLFSFDPAVLNRVSFINNTGSDIWYLFLSPGDSEEWGFDILGSERELEDNSILSFYVTYPDYENYFDIMAIDEDGRSFVLYDELFSDDGEINIIIGEGDLDEEDPGYEYVEVEIENQTDEEMYYLFISPSDSQMWGVDMMDDEQTLVASDTLSLLVPYSDDVISFDFMAVDTEYNEYQFSYDVHYMYTDDDDVLRIPIEQSDLVE